MKRTLIIKSLEQIKKGRTFHRSTIPQTTYNKNLWDELKAEDSKGYSIDLPRYSTNFPHRA